jgi:hypothetical protein
VTCTYALDDGLGDDEDARRRRAVCARDRACESRRCATVLRHGRGAVVEEVPVALLRSAGSAFRNRVIAGARGVCAGCAHGARGYACRRDGASREIGRGTATVNTKVSVCCAYL